MIVDIRFVSTFESVHHGDDTRIQLGRVEILYDDDTVDTFSNVDRGKYFRWIRNGFRSDDRPVQIELRDDEYYEDDDAENIPDDDYLAQVTGIPSLILSTKA